MIARTSLGVAALLLAALAAAPGRADTVDVPVILSLSGNGAFLGRAEQRTLELVERQANAAGGLFGKQVRFVYRDDETSPQVAVQLAATAIAAHPPAILGPGLVATCNAVAPLVKDGPLLWCFSPGIHPAPDGFVFTVPIATRDGQTALVRYFQDRGLTRLALLASTDATGHEAEGDLDAVLARDENMRVALVAREHFNPADLSAAAQMERVKAANPQVLFAWTTGAALATLLKAAVQAGLDIPVATTSGNMTFAQMKQYADFLPKELYLPSSVWVAGAEGMKIAPGVDAEQQRYFAAFKAGGVEPDGPAIFPWDPAHIVLDALRALGPKAGAAALRARIAALKAYAGVNGVYDFAAVPQRGVAVDYAVVTRWSGPDRFWKVVSRPGGAPLP